jgi:predicted transcriptional regulator of viral defense system
MLMGLYNNIKSELPSQFSIFQVISVLGIDTQKARQVRNLLNQFHKQGYIKRISKNMYKKIEN